MNRWIAAAAFGITLVSMFLLWTQEDLDLWMKLHYATTGSVNGNGWSGTILKQRLANLWFLLYAATAVLTPWLDRRLHRRLGVALRALLLIVSGWRDRPRDSALATGEQLRAGDDWSWRLARDGRRRRASGPDGSRWPAVPMGHRGNHYRMTRPLGSCRFRWATHPIADATTASVVRPG
jgi:hypothetical protein